MKFACFGRDLRAADPVALEPAGLEHLARAQVVCRILEDASERTLVRRLRLLSPGLHLGHDLADLLDWIARRAGARRRRRPGRGGRSSAGTRDRVRPGSASAVPLRGWRSTPGSGCLRDRPRTRLRSSRRLRRSCPGSRRRTRDLPRPASRARCRQTASGAPPPAVKRRLSLRSIPGLRVGERAGQLEDEAVEPVVGDEEVRPETDDGDRRAPGSSAQASSSTSSCTVSGFANQRAGPPVPSVVSLWSFDVLLDLHGRSVSRIDVAGAVDVARTDRQHEVARTRLSGDAARSLVEPRRPDDRHAGPELGQAVDDELAAHARDRLLPRRVDIGDADDVGAATAAAASSWARCSVRE